MASVLLVLLLEMRQRSRACTLQVWDITLARTNRCLDLLGQSPVCIQISAAHHDVFHCLTLDYSRPEVDQGSSVDNARRPACQLRLMNRGWTYWWHRIRLGLCHLRILPQLTPSLLQQILLENDQASWAGCACRKVGRIYKEDSASWLVSRNSFCPQDSSCRHVRFSQPKNVGPRGGTGSSFAVSFFGHFFRTCARRSSALGRRPHSYWPASWNPVATQEAKRI